MKLPLLLCVLLSVQAWGQQPASPTDKVPSTPEINTILMESTFFLQGPSAREGEENMTRFGTGFIMARPAKQDSAVWQIILITAKHVFDDIKGDTATLTLRRRNTAGDVESFPWPITIRDHGKNVYVVHPTADVAAMDIQIPTDSIIYQLGANGSMTGINWLATDDFLRSIGIHPGDDLLCLGFPLGIQINSYPILRSGKIASYPVTPSKKVGPIAYDFRVYPGNSGGPVYFSYSDRAYKNQLRLGTTYQKIFGIVTQQASPIQNVDPSLGIIVPSIFIKETIDILAGFESKIKEDF
jgi:Trypsin-like peptidase domain